MEAKIETSALTIASLNFGKGNPRRCTNAISELAQLGDVDPLGAFAQSARCR
jgi:hypothetical protein